MTMQRRDRVLIVGLARNLEDELEHTIRRMHLMFSQFFDTDFFIVESDSHERMNHVLKKIQTEIPNFRYVALGNLSDHIADRVERIRYCRDRYVSFIRQEISNRSWKYVIVSDLDGINSKLSRKSIESVLQFQGNWDVLTCNQTAPYYDIYALRCKGWVEYDCLIESGLESEHYRQELSKLLWHQVRKKRIIRKRISSIRKRLIYDKMHLISPKKEPIEEESAFGGIAFYKPKVFANFDYSKPLEIKSECEHVTLHRKIRTNQGSILILPGFINGGWNEHNLNKVALVRIYRRAKKRTKDRLVKFDSRINPM